MISIFFIASGNKQEKIIVTSMDFQGHITLSFTLANINWKKYPKLVMTG